MTDITNGKTWSATRAWAKCFTLALLLTLYAGLHVPFVYPGKDKGKLEGPDVFLGDFTYYVDGAISVFQTDPYEKFNNKHQPILQSRPLEKSADLRPGSALVAALYPFPSFKFGYSLTAAAVTWPWAHALFEQTIPRLAFTNFILGALVLVLLFLTLDILFGNIVVATAASVFYVFDVFNLHNNYTYQSHTIAGIFYVLLAYYVFVQGRSVSPLRFFIVSNLLVFSVLTSSHVVLLGASLGLLMALWIFVHERTWKRRAVFGVIGLAGVAVWPAYIGIVEWYVRFKDLGLPKYYEQFSNYGATVSNLISTYPLLQRQLWDLRIWNVFILVIVALIIVMFASSRRSNVPSRGIAVQRWNDWLVAAWNNKLLLFIGASAISIAGTAFYSQPIVRAIVPHLLLVDIFLGVFVGIALSRSSRLAVIGGALVAACLVFNFFLYTAVAKDNGAVRFVTVPPYAPGPYVWKVSERALIWKYVHAYFDKGAYHKLVLPKGELGQYSMPIPQFVEHVRREMPGDAARKHPDDVWIRLEPMEVVEQYSNTRRFIPRFTPLKENIVDADTIKKDFRLLNEILGMVRDKRLGEPDIVKQPVVYWNPEVFDQEYNYIYGYNGRIKELLAGLPLERLDFRSIYFVRLSALDKIAGKSWPHKTGQGDEW